MIQVMAVEKATGSGDQSRWRVVFAFVTAVLFVLMTAGNPAPTLAGVAAPGSPAPHKVAANQKPANRAPVIRRPIDLAPLKVGDEPLTVELSNHFRDPDDDPLVYGTVHPTVVLAVVAGGTLTLTPVTLGTGVVTVTATDPSGLYAELPISVTVRSGPNRAPVVTQKVWLGGVLAGDKEKFWEAVEERGGYSVSEGLYVVLTP